MIRCSRLATIPSSCTLFYQLAISGIVLLLIGLMLGETTIHMTSTLMVSLTFQTLVVAFSSHLIWFTLLRNYYVASLGTLVLMTPAMGIIAGVMFLGESLQPAFIVGLSAECPAGRCLYGQLCSGAGGFSTGINCGGSSLASERF